MGSHLIDDEFQSDKFPKTPRGLVPLSPGDPMAQDLLWEYAQRRRVKDAVFSDDLEEALRLKGYNGRNGSGDEQMRAAGIAVTRPQQNPERVVVLADGRSRAVRASIISSVWGRPTAKDSTDTKGMVCLLAVDWRNKKGVSDVHHRK